MLCQLYSGAGQAYLCSYLYSRQVIIPGRPRQFGCVKLVVDMCSKHSSSMLNNYHCENSGDIIKKTEREGEANGGGINERVDTIFNVITVEH